MRSDSRALVAAASALLAAAACGPQATVQDLDGADDAPAAEEAAAPPLEFADRAPVSAPANVDFVHEGVYYALHYAYSITDDDVVTLESHDIEAASMLTQAVPEHDAPFEGIVSGTNGDIAFAATEDGVRLIHAYEEDDTLRVRSFAADDGSLVYTSDEPVDIADEDVTIAGVDAARLLVAVSGGRWGDASFLFDTVTGDLLWSKADFRAVALHDGAIAGLAYPAEEVAHRGDMGEFETEFQVVSIADDTVHWSRTIENDPRLEHLGDGIVLIREYFSSWNLPESPDDALALVDTSSGTVLAETETQAEVECRYDGTAVVACFDLVEPGFAAHSAEDGSVLWTGEDYTDGLLPDRFLAEYGGVLYMDSAEGARPPVAIDAATGDLLAEDLPAGIAAVGPGYCITAEIDWDGRIASVYPEV